MADMNTSITKLHNKTHRQSGQNGRIWGFSFIFCFVCVSREYVCFGENICCRFSSEAPLSVMANRELVYWPAWFWLVIIVVGRPNVPNRCSIQNIFWKYYFKNSKNKNKNNKNHKHDLNRMISKIWSHKDDLKKTISKGWSQKYDLKNMVPNDDFKKSSLKNGEKKMIPKRLFEKDDLKKIVSKRSFQKDDFRKLISKI